jgi:hypothetical protein
MLIEDGKLNLDEFKARFDEFTWIKVPRQLGPNHTDFFFVCKHEDEDWIIEIKTRPSKRMKVSESYKHCDIKGNIVPKETKEKFVFGTTVEVVISDSVLDKISQVAKEKEKDGIQKIDF